MLEHEIHLIKMLNERPQQKCHQHEATGKKKIHTIRQKTGRKQRQ